MTPAEMAREIFNILAVYTPILMVDGHKTGEAIALEKIAAHLRSYGEECVMESRKADDRLVLSWKPLAEKANADGFRRGVEEAAKVAKELEWKDHGNDYCLDIAERIRKLEPTQDGGMK